MFKHIKSIIKPEIEIKRFFTNLESYSKELSKLATDRRNIILEALPPTEKDMGKIVWIEK
ncbi:hypothetical protein ETI08_03680 [Macrococcoides goetzii]|nr:hypothetical protein [Macrococcus goetzii]TDM48252.1 hypothetical protein ETI08_03680 [Macrococcus goetzii]